MATMQFSESQTLIRETAARFSDEVLAARAAKLDAGAQAGDGACAELYVDNLRRLAALGFNGLCVDEKYGGAAAGAVAYALAMFEFARGCAATTSGVSVSNMVAECVQQCGSEMLREKFLPPLMRGDFAAASFCLTEAGAGSDPAAMRTVATADGGGGWRISGAKQWITSGEIAGFFIVWAVTDSAAARGRGITCFVVDRDTPGVTIAPAVSKMGQHASPTNAIYFDGVAVAADHILGELNGGYRIAMKELFGGRLGIAAMALGVATAALGAAASYMGEREQHGRKLAGHQGLRWMLAERQTEVEAGFWLLMRAAGLKDAGLAYAKEAAMAKLFAADAGERATRDALQLHGGYGYMREFPLERYCRDIRITSIYEGSSEIQKQIIAKSLLA